MANMVEALTITTDTREFEITAVNLMVDQQENDIVDIRLAFPNGEDYLVLPKKQIKNLSLAYADFWTYMTENEILTYRSAVCDAYQTTGAYFYAVRYVESNLQDGGVEFYSNESPVVTAPAFHRRLPERHDGGTAIRLPLHALARKALKAAACCRFPFSVIAAYRRA